MLPLRLVTTSIFVFIVVYAQNCEDVISSCDDLKSICIGSILEYQLKQIVSLASQLNSSSIPVLENSLPQVESELPLVLGNQNGETSKQPSSDSETLMKNLPLIKESLPLIRESLPLIRESLPLIREYLDPLFDNGKTSCQKKEICKSCKACPKLRESLVRFVESLCPNTCRVCATSTDLGTKSQNLAAVYL
ncbi:unnamed protein product [Caenorhabditis bovis]|uniref:Uncharacterized protein n=1 Tax=Caenorhabditis bovis TaxID=2654633 RepID=A0A8S1ENB5_9PELO|nr:unnamed protein product [Caenorhabditis bovis]